MLSAVTNIAYSIPIIVNRNNARKNTQSGKFTYILLVIFVVLLLFIIGSLLRIFSLNTTLFLTVGFLCFSVLIIKAFFNVECHYDSKLGWIFITYVSLPFRNRNFHSLITSPRRTLFQRYYHNYFVECNFRLFCLLKT